MDDVDPGLDASRWGPAETLAFLRRSCSQVSRTDPGEKAAVVRMPRDRWEDVTPHDLLRAVERGLEAAAVAAERAATASTARVAYEHRIVPCSDVTVSEWEEQMDGYSAAGWELVSTGYGGRGTAATVYRRPLGTSR